MAVVLAQGPFMMTIGGDVISELKLRGSYGSYFCCEAYQDLAAIDSVDDLNAFLLANGMPWTCVEFDRRAVVDALSRHWLELSRQMASRSAWHLLDPTGIFGVVDMLLNHRERPPFFMPYRRRHKPSVPPQSPD